MSNFNFSDYEYGDFTPKKKEPVKETSQKVNQSFNFDDYEPASFSIEQPKESEGFLKSAARTLYQIPSGIAQAATYPLDLLNMIFSGEKYDPMYREMLADIHGGQLPPEAEDEYFNAAEQSGRYFPTQGNIESLLEEYTGAPLTPKTGLQKSLKLGSSAASFTPGSLLQKAVAGATAPAAATGLEKLGVPEGLAEFGGLLSSQPAAAFSPKSIGKATKSSGLPIRRYETTTKPKEITSRRKGIINEKVESDVRKLTDKLIQDSPIANTYNALEKDASFVGESEALFDDVKNLAENIPNKFSTDIIKKELETKLASREGTGITPSEYDTHYSKFLNDYVKQVPKKEFTASDLVEQYRKNNRGLRELYEVGQSKAYNRAKTDALLDYNRIIANEIERRFPNTEFSNLFKFSNKRWTEIKDSEAIHGFMDSIFTDKGIDFTQPSKVFKRYGVSDNFKRALGEENFAKFKQLMKDFSSTKQANQMLKVAKERGFDDLVKLGTYYLYKPWLIIPKEGYKIAKNAFNALLDKPRLAFIWDEGIQAAKAGNYTKAQKNFEILDKEVKTSTPKKETTIEVTPQKIEKPRQLEAPKKQIEQQQEVPKPKPPELKPLAPPPPSPKAIQRVEVQTKGKPETKAVSEKEIQPKKNKPIKEKEKSLSRQQNNYKNLTKEDLKKLSEEDYKDYRKYYENIRNSIEEIAFKNTKSKYNLKKVKTPLDLPNPAQEFYRKEIEDLSKSFLNSNNESDARLFSNGIDFEKHKNYIEKKLKENNIKQTYLFD